MEILELKNEITKIKARWMCLIAEWWEEERISEPDERTIDITQSEQQRENRLKNNDKEREPQGPWDDNERPDIHFIGVLEGEEKEGEAKIYSER